MHVWGIIVLSIIGLVSAQLPAKELANTNSISSTIHGTSKTFGKLSSVFTKPFTPISSRTPLNTIHKDSKKVEKNQLKFGSFNIQSFGITKLNKPNVVAALIQILSTYDIVLIQEIRMETTLFEGFINNLNDFVK
jgi:hypothetical protein